MDNFTLVGCKFELLHALYSRRNLGRGKAIKVRANYFSQAKKGEFTLLLFFPLFLCIVIIWLFWLSIKVFFTP